MKFVNIILLAILVSNIVLISSSVRRYRRNSQGLKNKWGNLVVSIAGELAGGDSTPFLVCLPEAWKSTPDASASDETGSAEAAASTFDSVIGVLDNIIPKVCEYKEQIKGLLGRRMMRRAKYRMFYQNKKWSLFGAIKGAASSVVSGVKNVASKVVAGVKSVGSAIVNTLIGPLKAIWNKFVAAVEKVFDSPLVQKILDTFSSCNLSNLKTAAQTVVATVKTVFAKIKAIFKSKKISDIVKLLIDTVCNWDDFKAAVNFLKQALGKGTVDKWLYIGKFLGRLAFAVSKTRRFSKYYRILRNYRRRYA